MSRSRVVHKATDALSAEAWRVMAQCFREKLPARMVVARVEQETGEKVAERTVSRRMREWHLEQQRRRAAREQMLALVEAVKDGGLEPAQMLIALGVDALTMNPNGLTEKDPLRVQALALRAQEMENKRRELDLRERQVAVDERKLAALLEREKRAAEAAEDLEKKAAAGGQVTAEDVRRIREVYGLESR